MNMRHPSDSGEERKPINYKTDAVKGIESKVCTAWELVTPYQRHIFLFAAEATIENVHNFIKVHHPHTKFCLSRVDIGQFKVSKVVDSYKGDGRWVDQDWNVVLDPNILDEQLTIESYVPGRVPPIISRPEPPNSLPKRFRREISVPVKSCGCPGFYHTKSCALNNDT